MGLEPAKPRSKAGCPVTLTWPLPSRETKRRRAAPGFSLARKSCYRAVRPLTAVIRFLSEPGFTTGTWLAESIDMTWQELAHSSENTSKRSLLGKPGGVEKWLWILTKRGYLVKRHLDGLALRLLKYQQHTVDRPTTK